MFNFRSPVKIFLSSLQKAHYSSSNEKVGQELLKQGHSEVANKVKSDNLLNLLPYLQHIRTETISQTSTIDTQSEEKTESYGADKNDLVKSLVTHPPVEASNETNVSCESLKELSKSSPNAEKLQDPPQSLPVLIATRQSKSPTVDLSDAMLPISLHRDKKSLLVDTIVQDVKHLYFKTSTKIDGWYLVAKVQSRTAYISLEEYMKQPRPLQDFLRDRVGKNAVSIYEPKLSALANIDVSSIIEKVKQLIENIVTSLKKMFEKKPEKSGKEDKKAEEKVEKTDKTEEGVKK